MKASVAKPLIKTILTLMVIHLVSVAAVAQEVKKETKPRYVDPKNVDTDFAFQGEYSGELGLDDKSKFGVQVIANGDGKFSAVGFPGGLPGDGFNGEKLAIEDGQLKDGELLLVAATGSGLIRDGKMLVRAPDGTELGTLEKVTRKSKSLGSKPPPNAIVLFDGSNADEWKNGKLSDDGLLMQGTTSKKTFGSHKLHIEFRLPYMPKDRGQGRGNSGVYVQGKYEVQMLDSFGLDGKMNECGGIYSVKGCDLNMCFPPLSWQTYDIEYKAAKYEDGKLVANPRMTVFHNGEKIHDNVELPGERNTTAAPVKAGPGKGPVYLQNHRCPVRYRNIWVVETD